MCLIISHQIKQQPGKLRETHCRRIQKVGQESHYPARYVGRGENAARLYSAQGTLVSLLR